MGLLVHIDAQSSALELCQQDLQFDSGKIEELLDTYLAAPDVLVLIKELDSTDTLSYFLDDIVGKFWRESWNFIMTRIIRNSFTDNMLKV